MGKKSAAIPLSSYDTPKPVDDETASFNWRSLLHQGDFEAAPVKLMKHAPLSRVCMEIGTKVEVENVLANCDEPNNVAYWVASVIKTRGYLVLLRFEGFENDDSADFWINVGTHEIHHVGWCADTGMRFIPPEAISTQSSDWRNFLLAGLTGASTIPANFSEIITASSKPKYKLGDLVEVVDSRCVSQLRVATVTKSIGRRLLLEHLNSDDPGFWCHEDSRLLHPKGWAKTIGHYIISPPKYNPIKLNPTPYDNDFEKMGLRVGMKLEAVDPLNPVAICAATIKKVLRRGYVMIRIDSYEEDKLNVSGSTDWFCYHIASPYILKCGFCQSNGILLTPPFGYKETDFNWDEYFKETRTRPAPIKPKSEINHGFRVGMKLESADLMESANIYVATITRVVGRLLKIHFDGWHEEYDQWVDCRSPDIYPVGWCELVNYKLTTPLNFKEAPTSKKKSKGRRRKLRRSQRKSEPPPKKLALSVKVQPDCTRTLEELKTSSPTTSVGILKTESLLVSADYVEMSDSGVSVDSKAEVDSKPFMVPHEGHDLTRSCIPSIESANVDGIPSHSSSVNPITLAVKTLRNKISNHLSTSVVNTLICKIPLVSDIGTSGCWNDVDPTLWENTDVVAFLHMNGCGAYVANFQNNNVTGKALLKLTKDQIVILTGMKVGPALKILNLVDWLRRIQKQSYATQHH